MSQGFSIWQALAERQRRWPAGHVDFLIDNPTLGSSEQNGVVGKLQTCRHTFTVDGTAAENNGVERSRRRREYPSEVQLAAAQQIVLTIASVWSSHHWWLVPD